MRPVVAPDPPDRRAPKSIPHTVRRAFWATSPRASAQNTGKVHAEKHPLNSESSPAKDPGAIGADSHRDDVTPVALRILSI